ncbi:MAG: sialate O-acetylesterase [Luteolibacter sp.]|uniref:sialate O-acetylesterase n=1 Tax=Luteolibacter sp. TaxID=1962973 RepID=UPI003265E705
MRSFIPSIFLSFVTLPLGAAVEFDPVFSPGMVIQRTVPIRLSGKGTPGHEIKVSLDATGKTAAVAADGSWSAEFPAMRFGGPHVLKAVDGEEAATLDDVLIGDVWVCSGQSNMQMGVREAIGGKEAMVEAAAHPDIRILTIPRAGAPEPQKKCDAKWQAFSSEDSGDFSAVAWFFALQLKKDPALAKVPLGIINSSFGGTAIEAWTPADSLPPIPKEQISGSMFGIPSGALFNGMISPLTALRIKGVTWYQGEANAGHPTVYATLLANLMEQWRAKWQQPDLPFFIVQLPVFDGKWDGYDFSWLREAQAAACVKTKNAWLATTFDTTDGHDLHPVDKQEIGRRLALLARRETNSSKIVASGPVPDVVSVQGNKLRVAFKSSDGLTTVGGKAPVGFAIAGMDGDFRYAKATIEGTAALLENADIPMPETVRYAWGATPSGNLANRSGLPVAPFRTDLLPPGKVAFQLLPATHKVETPRYELTTGENGQISSLIVGGKQFLSNEKDGGTRIPDGFGSRNFGVAEELGPRRLRASDNTGSLEIACADDSMEWILRNDRDKEIEFRISLSAQAKVQVSDGSAEVSRDNVKLKIDGIDRAESSEIVAKIQPHSTSTLRLQLLP